MHNEFFRYFFASASAFLVDYLTLFLSVDFFGFHYLVGAALGFIIGSIYIYIASTLWVFTSRSFKNRLHEFLIFVAIGLVGLLLNTGVLWGLTGLLGLHYLLSKIVSAGVVFSFNFLLRRFFLFRIENAPHGK